MSTFHYSEEFDKPIPTIRRWTDDHIGIDVKDGRVVIFGDITNHKYGLPVSEVQKLVDIVIDLRYKLS